MQVYQRVYWPPLRETFLLKCKDSASYEPTRTPRKTNMEPENEPLEEEIPIRYHITIIFRFHVIFRGEYTGMWFFSGVFIRVLNVAQCKCLVEFEDFETIWIPTATYRIHVWTIYLHLPYIYKPNVGRYSSPMDPMGMFNTSTYSSQSSSTRFKRLALMPGPGIQTPDVQRYDWTPKTY